MFEQKYLIGRKLKMKCIKDEFMPAGFRCLPVSSGNVYSQEQYADEAKNGDHFIDVTVTLFDFNDNTYEVSRDGEEGIWAHFLYLCSDTVTKTTEVHLCCIECKQFYPYAVANMGDKLVCWNCCDSNGWKYSKKHGVVSIRS